jgi:L-rhamnose mutarotase
MERYAMVLRVRPEFEREYLEYHKAVWPEVLELIRDCNVRNYSIFLRDHCLFAYYEYAGVDYKSDMAKMAAHPKMKKWWEIMEPMQEPVPTHESGEWWVRMEEAFHTD